MPKRIFIIADHGLALIYFLQSDVIATLLAAGVEVVFFTDDESLPMIENRFSQPGLVFEGIRANECERYAKTVDPFIQRCLAMLRWIGGSKRINITALDGNYQLLEKGFSGRGRYALPFLRLLIWMMRRSRALRRFIVHLQNRYTAHIYADLFEKYQPQLVLARTPGWRNDRYILREAARARHSHSGSDCWMGQSVFLCHERRAGGRYHLLVGDPEGRVCAGVGLGSATSPYLRDPCL